MTDEDEPKEYRWETGYERTWYGFNEFFATHLMFEKLINDCK